MSRVHRRGVIAGPKSGGGKTYAEFVAQITALAVDGERTWDSMLSWAASGLFTTTAAAATGTMVGSSWSARFRAGGGETAAARVVQHGLLSEPVFDDQVLNGRKIFLQIISPATGPAFAALNRNGYLSTASASTTQPRQCTRIIRWDGTQAWESNPSIGGAETLYTW